MSRKSVLGSSKRSEMGAEKNLYSHINFERRILIANQNAKPETWSQKDKESVTLLFMSAYSIYNKTLNKNVGAEISEI